MLEVYFYGFISSEVIRPVNVPILSAFMSQLARFFSDKTNLLKIADLPVLITIVYSCKI